MNKHESVNVQHIISLLRFLFFLPSIIDRRSLKCTGLDYAKQELHTIRNHLGLAPVILVESVLIKLLVFL